MSQRGSWGNCPLCDYPLNSPNITVCPNCHRDIVYTNGSWKGKEQAEHDKAVSAAQGLAAAAIVFFLLTIVFKLIVRFFKFARKKPKTAFLIVIIISAIGYDVWNNTPSRLFFRAEQMLQNENSYTEGVKLLKSASDKAYTPAMLRYAEILAKGEYGVQADPQTAISLLESSQLAYDAEAQFTLGQLLADGDGIEKNYAKARECFLFALNNGITNAQNEAIKMTVLAWLTAVYQGDAQLLNKLSTSDMSQFVSFYNKNKKERESLLKEIERFQDVNIEFKNKEEAVVSPRENPNVKFFVFFRPTEWLVSSIGGSIK